MIFYSTYSTAVVSTSTLGCQIDGGGGGGLISGCLGWGFSNNGGGGGGNYDVY